MQFAHHIPMALANSGDCSHSCRLRDCFTARQMNQDGRARGACHLTAPKRRFGRDKSCLNSRAHFPTWPASGAPIESSGRPSAQMEFLQVPDEIIRPDSYQLIVPSSQRATLGRNNVKLARVAQLGTGASEWGEF